MNPPWAASRSSQPATGSAGPPLASVSAAAPIQAWWAFTANAAAGTRAASPALRARHLAEVQARPAEPHRYRQLQVPILPQPRDIGDQLTGVGGRAGWPGDRRPGLRAGERDACVMHCHQSRPPIRPRYPSLPPQSSPPQPQHGGQPKVN